MRERQPEASGRVEAEHEHGQQKRPVHERREKGRCERGEERRARKGQEPREEDQEST